MVDPRCEICCKKPESVGHLLWECPLARNVWAICQGKIHKCPNDAREFFALFRMLVDRLPEMELDRWATISGRYGMLEINITLNMFSDILK